MNVGNWATRLPLAVRQDGLVVRLARFVARRPVSLALAAVCVIVDRAVPWHGMSFMARALIDEPCHVATALVVLGTMVRVRSTPPDPKLGWAMLAASVLIDVDHLPDEFGSSALTVGTPRPYTHALWLVAMLIAATVIARHWWPQPAKTPAPATTARILAGTAWGVSAHFFRDVATAPMALWWPVSNAAAQVPYWWYVLALLLIIAVPPVRSRKSVVDGQPSENAVGVR